MRRFIPQSWTDRVALIYIALTVTTVVVLVLQTVVFAAPYVNPFWTNTSPSPESPVPSVAALAISPEGVDVRTGELIWSHFLFRTPGVLEDNVFGLTWRSMLSGSSQLGNRMIPSWEMTAQYQVLIPGTPNAPFGHQVVIRRRSGRMDTFTWNGAAYTAPTNVFDTLSGTPGTGYSLADRYACTYWFDLQGMPQTFTDQNANIDAWTYNVAFQLTSITDERGKTYATTFNANNYLSSIKDPANRIWYFGYDAFDNLTTITSPPTTDQPTGIVTTLAYDGQGRLTSVTDGRGNTVRQFAYVTTTNQISSVTINGNAVSYSYATGVTTRTDRNANVHRSYFTGQQITKTDMLVGGQSKYATLYRYSGGFLSNVVLPRGNRIDFTFDAAGNLTQRRHRTTDTGTNDSSDLVHQWGYNGGNWMVGYTDPRGNAWSFSRDIRGNLTGITHPTVTSPQSQTASKSFVYNSLGQVTQSTDEEGTTTDYSYFGSGSSQDLLAKTEVDATGLDIENQYTYDTAGNIATRTDPRGKVWNHTWDNLRRLMTTTSPSSLGYEVKYSYDANGNPVQKDVENVDKDGTRSATNPWFTTTYTWTNTDDLSTLVEEIDVSTTRTFNFDYDNNQNRIRITKPEGNKEKWEFDERDHVIKHLRGEGAANASDTEYEYDLNGNRTVIENGRGCDTDITYDLFDRQTKITNALSHYTEYTLDKNGNITKIQRKNSSDVVLQREDRYYDERNRLWKTSGLFKTPSQTYSDAVTTIERLKTGQAKTLTNPRGKITTRDYDAAGRLIQLTDPMGSEWDWVLDDAGNPIEWSIEETDGTNTVTHEYEATYDEINRRSTLVEIDRTNPNNTHTTQSYYDSRSNLVFRVNAEGNPTRWTFDGLDRMIKRERALTLGATINDFLTAQVTQWGIDDNSRLISHKDDSPNESTCEYDDLDRVTSLTYPDNSSAAYVYDLADNITQTTDPAGNVINDTFDSVDRNTARSITRATGFLGTTSETRAYDSLNRMTSNADNDYNLDFEYTVIGLDSYLHEETQSYVGQMAYPKSVNYAWDANGNLIQETYPTGCNLTVDRTYNDADLLTQIDDGTNTIASYTWIGVRKKGTTFGNSSTRANTYTGFRFEIGSIQHATSSQTSIVRLDYGYNKVHDKLYERFGGSGSSGDAFAYDKMRRLTNAWMGSVQPSSPSGQTYVKKIDYNYDDDGNRNSVALTLWNQNPANTSYTTNNLNQYTVVGGTSRSHDSNGNLTDNGTYQFKYDYKNQIVQVIRKSDSTTIASYRYDALGRRVEKNTLANGVERHVRSTVSVPGTTVENFSHVIAVFDGTNNWIQNFVFNDEIDGIQMLEQADVLDHDTDGNTTELTRSYYHRNELGSVMEITDALQQTAVTYRYDPYGQVTITRNGQTQASDPLGQYWTFTGRFHDEESGLCYYRARAYDPDTGRFLQRDPLGYVEGPNLLLYVNDSPMTHRDAAGLRGGRGPVRQDNRRRIERIRRRGGYFPRTPFEEDVWRAYEVSHYRHGGNVPGSVPGPRRRTVRWPKPFRPWDPWDGQTCRGHYECICKYKWVIASPDGSEEVGSGYKSEVRLGPCLPLLPADCDKRCDKWIASFNAKLRSYLRAIDKEDSAAINKYNQDDDLKPAGERTGEGLFPFGCNWSRQSIAKVSSQCAPQTSACDGGCGV